MIDYILSLPWGYAIIALTMSPVMLVAQSAQDMGYLPKTLGGEN